MDWALNSRVPFLELSGFDDMQDKILFINESAFAEYKNLMLETLTKCFVDAGAIRAHGGPLYCGNVFDDLAAPEAY